jgi:hypothetical protein
MTFIKQHFKTTAEKKAIISFKHRSLNKRKFSLQLKESRLKRKTYKPKPELEVNADTCIKIIDHLNLKYLPKEGVQAFVDLIKQHQPSVADSQTHYRSQPLYIGPRRSCDDGSDDGLVAYIVVVNKSVPPLQQISPPPLLQVPDTVQ